ncbi:unnamed protein product [Arabis nemorensis]|uniref:Retrotransposon gag domain-containing protein n=1 Tax=Arabis nemorensis TaxID=586526 RepID=A0A565BIW2_9BRAS|nr:unnamed protein product [Arabis nemorensis]
MPLISPPPPDPQDLPKFDGNHLREWIRRCEQFFDRHHTPPEQKTHVVSPYMVGKALQWHQKFMREHYGTFPSWIDFAIAIFAEFGKSDDDPISEPVNLKQSSDSVEVYLGKFECLLTKMSLPIHHALTIFLKNISPPLALYARKFDVTTAAEAARMAKIYESLQYPPIRQPQAPFNPSPKPNTQQHHIASSLYQNSNAILKTKFAGEVITDKLKEGSIHQIQETAVTEYDSYSAKQRRQEETVTSDVQEIVAADVGYEGKLSMETMLKNKACRCNG